MDRGGVKAVEQVLKGEQVAQVEKEGDSLLGA